MKKSWIILATVGVLLACSAGGFLGKHNVAFADSKASFPIFIEKQKLLPDDDFETSYFGVSVSIDGDTAAIPAAEACRTLVVARARAGVAAPVPALVGRL